MGTKKNLRKLWKEPTEMHYNEVKNVLEYFGYELTNIKGSHHKFTLNNFAFIMFPVHTQKVQRVYLKNIKNTLTQLLREKK